jgi:hypothetical protein
MTELHVSFDTNVSPPPSPVTEALLDVMTCWHNLPKSICGESFEKAKVKCGVVYRLHKQEKNAWLDANQKLTGLYRELEHDNMVLQETHQKEYNKLVDDNKILEERLDRLETHYVELSDKHTEVLCNYNSLRNRYRRLLGQTVNQIPQLRPANKKRKRKTSMESLFLDL